MWKDAYLESRVLSADPIELIRLLYQTALDSVQTARRNLAAGNIAERSRAVCRAIAAVGELDAALDHAAGGAISRNLAALYQYIRQRLTEGNMRQKDAPLAEAQSLLATLAEAWNNIGGTHPAEPAAAKSFEPMAGAWQEQAGASAHTWCA